MEIEEISAVILPPSTYFIITVVVAVYFVFIIPIWRVQKQLKPETSSYSNKKKLHVQVNNWENNY